MSSSVKEKNSLDIFEAFAMLSKGTKRIIYGVILGVILISLIAVFRLNLLMFSIKYFYENISSFTPFITLASTGLMIAYMFRNGQVMAYLKTLPALILSMFEKNRLETESMVENVRKQMFEMQSKQDDVSAKQKEELAKLQELVVRIDSGNNVTHDKIAKVKVRVTALEKENTTDKAEIGFLKQQQNIILEFFIKNGGIEKHTQTP